MERRHAVVFDLGNVLIRWDPRHLYRQLFDGDDAAMERFLAEVCTSSWNERHDGGHPIASGTAELIRLHPAHETLIRAYYGRWSEMLDGAIAANVAVLERLAAARVPIYALSNWSAETFPIARRLFPFLGLFQGIVLSGEERLLKPDPRFFHVLFSRYALDPAQCVFIDDLRKNTDAAEGLGMRTVHYTPDVDLDGRLASLGVWG